MPKTPKSQQKMMNKQREPGRTAGKAEGDERTTQKALRNRQSRKNK